MDTDKRFSLRMAADLHAQIEELAKDDLRSVHAEIIILLREAVQARKEKAEKGKK